MMDGLRGSTIQSSNLWGPLRLYGMSNNSGGMNTSWYCHMCEFQIGTNSPIVVIIVLLHAHRVGYTTRSCYGFS